MMSGWKVGLGVLMLAAIGFVPSRWFISFNQQRSEYTVGSKAFTENIILGEAIRLLGKSKGIAIDHQAEIQGTQIVFKYLVNDSVDFYPEYVGTIRYEILQERDLLTEDEVRNELRQRYNIGMSRPLGFENTYALGMLESRAEELGIESISDLKNHPDLTYSLSQEFLEREDGWRKMAATYGLKVPTPKGNDHALTYKQLESGAADVIVLYSTDSKIKTLNIRPLEDDLKFFPNYASVILYRLELESENPELMTAIHSLEGQIDSRTMISLNARCEVDEISEKQVAAEFLSDQMGIEVEVSGDSIWRDIARNTVEHVDLVRMSMVACMFVAVPLGIMAARIHSLGQVILGVIGVLQTIPGIALLVMLIAPTEWFGRTLAGQDGLGASVIPVIVALFIYSLLPVVRNTYTGLVMIPGNLKESALALGLTPWARLWKIDLPLATPSILSGIKTAAVINVGFACLGAMIGGGGYGQPIFSGVRLSDTHLILQGAIPAAIMALLVQFLFELVERQIVPKGLKS